MSLAILDINDTGIEASVDGECVLVSPGYAVLDGDTLLVGEKGARNARLLPRWTSNRFWHELNLQPLQNATHSIRHNADLTLAHLEEIWAQIGNDATEVILAIPSGYDREQLGLLLGIARECEIPVRGTIESSLAALAGQSPTGRALHLDIQLHQITLSVIESGIALRHMESLGVGDAGYFTLADRWAQIISEQFIHTTRFDPMHEAHGEQALFDQIPDWIRKGSATSAEPFTLTSGSTERSVAVSSAQLARACAEIYPEILQAVRAKMPAGQLYISHRFEGFPGLRESLDLLTGCDIIPLTSNAVAEGIASHIDEIRASDSALTFVTSLAANEVPLQRSQTIDSAAPPTHVLFKNQALAIGDRIRIAAELTPERVTDDISPHCTVYRNGREVLLDNHSPAGTLVNGESVMDLKNLCAGDQVTIGSEQLLLITVLDSHGS